MTSRTDVTRDAYLGGKLQIYQPKSGYRAGVDPVFLAASVPARSGQSVLELGCGAGAAILCLGARVPGLCLTGVEVQPNVAALAAENGGSALEVVTADLAELPKPLRMRQFDHVLVNPPYFDRDASVSSANALRETAHAEATPLAVWVRVAAKRLKPKGMAHFIHRAERLPDLIRALPDDLGSVEVLPLAARTGRAPDRVILRARKNGRAAFKLHAARILHEGAQHIRDGDSFQPWVQKILRDGAALEF